jgi:hypothetical protein
MSDIIIWLLLPFYKTNLPYVYTVQRWSLPFLLCSPKKTPSWGGRMGCLTKVNIFRTILSEVTCETQIFLVFLL